MGKIFLNDLDIKEMEEIFKNINEPSFRATQLFEFFNKSLKTDLEGINFKKELIDKLDKIGKVNKINLYKKFKSKVDDTIKYLFLLEDGNIIESVLMKYKHGNTVCISTQVGCRMSCSFCASTKEGLIRNLSPSEMLNQIYMIEKDSGLKVSNIVLMGAGEPLDNIDNVVKFIYLINNKKGKNLSMRNITLSTCGLVDGIDRLREENLPITLSISLHSPFDEERSKIMPINKRYKISELMRACSNYYNKTKRRITIEYTLIDGINDTARDAEEIAKIIKDFQVHINLIPLNPIKEYNRDRSSNKSIKNFKEALESKGLRVTVRREMGMDISASCGQLRRSVTQNKEGD